MQNSTNLIEKEPTLAKAFIKHLKPSAAVKALVLCGSMGVALKYFEVTKEPWLLSVVTTGLICLCKLLSDVKQEYYFQHDQKAYDMFWEKQEKELAQPAPPTFQQVIEKQKEARQSENHAK